MSSLRATVVSALFLSQVLAPGQESPVFRSESNLVPIYAQVVDGDTQQPIGGLAREDFAVLDEGKPVQLSLFDASPTAVDLVLLLDMSGQFRNEGILFTTDAFLRLREPDDRYALISFSDGKAQRHTGLTDDEGEIQDARETIFGIDAPRHAETKTSRLFDAIQYGVQVLARKPSRQRHSAIVVVTHDREAHSKVTKSALIAALLDSGITVDAITIPQEVPTPYRSINTGIFPGISIEQHARGPYVPTYLNDLHSVDKIVAATGGLSVPLKYRVSVRGIHLDRD